VTRITWNELTVSLDGVDLDDLLSEWRWLVSDEYQPVVISALGDLFLRHADGRIFRLDTGWGELTDVAKDAADFKKRMVQPENCSEWFGYGLVAELIASGAALGRHQCFSYKKPPKLGGKVEADNFEPTDLSVHFGILGQIQRQIKDLPPGTPIGKFNIK
jgi:T6SS immunity protein Tdi1, C-terminal